MERNLVMSERRHQQALALTHLISLIGESERHWGVRLKLQISYQAFFKAAVPKVAPNIGLLKPGKGLHREKGHESRKRGLEASNSYA